MNLDDQIRDHIKWITERTLESVSKSNGKLEHHGCPCEEVYREIIDTTIPEEITVPLKKVDQDDREVDDFIPVWFVDEYDAKMGGSCTLRWTLTGYTDKYMTATYESEEI